MITSIYFERNREKTFIKKDESSIKRLKSHPLPSKTIPSSVNEIKLFNTKATTVFQEDNYTWLTSFQKEVQLEAELVTNEEFSAFYLDGIKRSQVIYINNKMRTPDFVSRAEYKGKSGFMIEMKTRNSRDRLEYVMKVDELQEKIKSTPLKNWGDLVDLEEDTIELEKIKKDFHLKDDDQIEQYQEYCNLNNLTLIILIVNYNCREYGFYYNACLSLISNKLSKLRKKLDRKDLSKILEKKISPVGFLKRAEDTVKPFDTNFNKLKVEMGFETEDIYSEYRENRSKFDKSFICNLARNLPNTINWVNNSILDVKLQAKLGLDLLSKKEGNVLPEYGTNYGKQLSYKGIRTRTECLLYLPISECVEPVPLIENGFEGVRETQSKLYDLMYFTQKYKSLFDEYEQLNAQFGEYVSNSSKLENNKVEIAVDEAVKGFKRVIKKLKKEGNKYGIEVDDSCYIRHKEGFIKEKHNRVKYEAVIDFKDINLKLKEILEGIRDYLDNHDFYLEDDIEFENPLHGLLCANLGKVYANLGSKYINELYTDSTFRYLRVIMSIFDQYNADTKKILARNKTKRTSKFDMITEWCKVTKLKYLPIIIISSPPSTQDYNGLLVINTFHYRTSEIEDYLLEGTYFNLGEKIMRMQAIMRLHPHVTETFHEYLCAYAGDYIVYQIYGYKDETFLIKSLYWQINRNMVKFASLLYLLYQKSTLKLTLGKEDLQKEFEGLRTNDIRIALFLQNLWYHYHEFVEKSHAKLLDKEMTFKFRDPVFGIPLNDIQINLALINIKQIYPKRDGFVDIQVKSKYIIKEGKHQTHWQNSNFADGSYGLENSFDVNYNRIFRKNPYKTLEELDKDGEIGLINYFDSSTFHPQVMTWALLNATADNYGDNPRRKESHFPFNRSYWAKNTPSSLYVPKEYNIRKAALEDKPPVIETGFVSMKVPEASIDLLKLIADAIDAQIHQVTIGDFLEKFDTKKFSIVFCQTKEQKGTDKRIFFITIVNKRITYIAFDNSFEEFLLRDKHDILEKPGEKKFLTFEQKMQRRFLLNLITLITLDATRFGDEMNLEGLKLMVHILRKLGYYDEDECKWAIGVLDSLSKRFLVLPKEFVKLMKKISEKSPDTYISKFKEVLEWTRVNSDVRDFFEEASKEYEGLDNNICMLKRVGFVLGVLNRCGTLTSVLIGHSFVNIQNLIFKGIDADWATMSDDAIGMASIYDEFDFSTRLTPELIKKFIDYVNSDDVWSVSTDHKKIVNNLGEEMLSYSEWVVLSWGLLLLLYKALCQNISTKKSGMGFTGEVLQVFLGYGKAILSIYKQVVNLGSTMQFFSAYEDLMSMLGSMYSLYVLGASMVLISTMFYLASSLIKTLYRIDLKTPFDFVNPYWGPTELTLSFWMLPEAIRYTGFSGKERLLALYETSDNELIKTYKKLSIIIIDNNEYVKSGKIDYETKETKAVSTNRVHLFILTMNKLKTKETFFSVLRTNGNTLIEGILHDIVNIKRYGMNIPRILESCLLLRRCLGGNIGERELEIYDAFEVKENKHNLKHLKKGFNLKEYGGSIIRKLVSEIKVFIIISYPKTYVRILTFLNKYLSRGFQLSYNKLSRASQIKSRLGFKTRKNLNFFTDKIDKVVYNYNPETMNNKQICNILMQFAADSKIENLSELSRKTYLLEREFNRVKIDFYTGIEILGGYEEHKDTSNLEMEKSWTVINDLLSTNIFYYSIVDIITYVIEVLIKKVKNPVLFDLKPNYSTLTSFKDECMFIYKLLKTYGFNDSSIIANYNSISQTLEMNKSPKTMRLPDNKEIMSQTKFNHRPGFILNFAVNFKTEIQMSRYIPFEEENEDLFRYCLLCNKNGFVKTITDVLRVEDITPRLSNRLFFYRNFHLWLNHPILEFCKFTVSDREETFFGIRWSEATVGLSKVEGTGTNSKFKLISTNGSIPLTTLLDICFSITKYLSEDYKDSFVSLIKNIYTSTDAESNVTIEQDGSYKVFATFTSRVWFHVVNRNQINITHKSVRRDYSIITVANSQYKKYLENAYHQEEDEEEKKKKYYVSYPTFIYQFKDTFELLDENKEEIRFNKKSDYKLPYFLNLSKKMNNYAQYISLAIIVNVLNNPYYSFSEQINSEDWCLSAWFYYFNIDINDIIKNINMFELKNDFEHLNVISSNLIGRKINDLESSNLFVNKLFDKKGLINNGLNKLDFLLKMVHNKKESSSLMLALKTISPLVRNGYPIETGRFLRSDIYFEKSQNKYDKSKIIYTKVNRNVDLITLFTDQNLGENWVKKEEIYISDQDLKQMLFVFEEHEHSVLKIAMYYNLIKQGCVFRRILDFIEDTTGIQITFDLNVIDDE